MKNYRSITPFILIGFVIFAIYSRVTAVMEQQATYNGYLQQARAYREGQIYTDAMQQYQNALDMKLTLEVCQEVGEMYLEQGNSSNIESWGKYLVETFPKEVSAYEYLIDYQLSRNNYKKCFELYDTVEKRSLYSQTLAEKMNSIRYVYELDEKDYTYVADYSCSYCYFIDEDNGLYGYCNVNGKEAIKAKYFQASAFGTEYASIQDETGEFYFIDAQGNRKLNVPKDVEITKVGFLSSDRYPIGTEGEMYFADLQGNLVLGPYEDVTTYNGNIAAVKENGLWYLIDLTGNKLSEGYLEIAMDVKEIVLKNGVIFAKTNQGYICLNAQGERINKEYYEDVRCFLDTTYTAVKQNGKWGFVDNSGNMQIEPQYEDAKPFSNGLAAVKIDGLWGYIDSNGVIAIKPAFLEANSITENGTTFVMNSEGKWTFLEIIGGI